MLGINFYNKITFSAWFFHRNEVLVINYIKIKSLASAPCVKLKIWVLGIVTIQYLQENSQ